MVGGGTLTALGTRCGAAPGLLGFTGGRQSDCGGSGVQPNMQGRVCTLWLARGALLVRNSANASRWVDAGCHGAAQTGTPRAYRVPPLPCRWESQGYFKPDPAATGEPFTIPMPPPNVTGKLHMGHAMFATLQVCPCKGREIRGVCVYGFAGGGV